MTPVELSRVVLDAVRRAVAEGELGGVVPERVVVGEPGAGGCGEYATNVALQLARAAGKPPLQVAEILRPRLVGVSGVRDVVVTGPGFLNFLLEERADPLGGLVREIRRSGARYGHGDALAGEVVALRVPYEVRAEVVADAVVRIVASQGGRATVEHREPVNVRPVPAPEDPAPLGPDAARWALLHPAPHDRPRITADHLVQREANPLFRVRYAHARVRAAGRNAARLGFDAEPGRLGEGAAHSDALQSPLADYPRILAAAATHRAPDRLARHLVTVADAVLPFVTCVLPLGEEKPSAAHRARLALAEAAGTVLAGGLSLLGIDAPEHL
ncbi:arginyl-tRNA synthetase [Streptomyces misionensis]|uniref:arginine--tRNA ligase n=1 Tax=Streptomyces misionensis TaxID=67331 RepID=A0A1H5C1M5_9ACTN|nr:DALR anticodon-binding domain-containing protein [Streptomyces misionensis]SED60749.1 arginyl-tRNA synthetase [Streptomyces misionensis]